MSESDSRGSYLAPGLDPDPPSCVSMGASAPALAGSALAMVIVGRVTPALAGSPLADVDGKEGGGRVVPGGAKVG